MALGFNLSIIVINYKAMNNLRRCLESIEQTIGGINYELIVVDNGSLDGSAHFVRAEFPQARLIANSENLGFSTANNQGLRIARGDYILLLNNDTVVLPDALQTMLGIMEKHPGIGLLGCQLNNIDGSVQKSHSELTSFLRRLWNLIGDLYETRSSEWMKKVSEYNLSSQREVDWVNGVGMMLRKQAIFDAELLDEKFFIFYESIDLCHRFKQLGWKVVYTPSAEIVHFGGVSAFQNSRQMRLEFFKSRLYYYSKHYGTLGLSGIRFYLMLKVSKDYLLWQFIQKFKGFFGWSIQERDRSIGEIIRLIRNYR